jgi:hypothetical protein
VLDLVGLKQSILNVISVLTQRRKGMLDSMVRWYPRKTHFTTFDRCSRRIGILTKMLVIELKPVG